MKSGDWIRIKAPNRLGWRGKIEQIDWLELSVRTQDNDVNRYMLKDVELIAKIDMPSQVKELVVWDIIESKDWLEARIMSMTDDEVLTTRRGELWNSIDRIARGREKFFEMFAKQERKIKEKFMSTTYDDFCKMFWESIIEWYNDENLKITDIAIWDYLYDLENWYNKIVVDIHNDYYYIASPQDWEPFEETIKRYKCWELTLTKLSSIQERYIKRKLWQKYLTRERIERAIQRRWYVLVDNPKDNAESNTNG